MTSLHKIFQILLVLACAAVCSAPVLAQGDEIETQFRQVSAEEDKRLRATLAGPIPDGASLETLRKHFKEKDAAAIRLGEPLLRENVQREAIKRLPDPHLRNDLANSVFKRGQIEEGNALRQQAIQGESGFNALMIKANAACDAFDQNQNELARQMIAANMLEIVKLQTQAMQTWQKREVARGGFRNTQCLSLLEQRFGKNQLAIAAAIEVKLMPEAAWRQKQAMMRQPCCAISGKTLP